MSQKKKAIRPDVYQFEDYRIFLKELFEFFKGAKRYFSFRSFAKKAGFGSPNYLQAILRGQRNLSMEACIRVARVCELSDAESKFFKALVAYTQSQDAEEKAEAYDKIIKNKRFQRYKPLEKAQYDYFTKWYLPVVRELVGLEGFKEDPAWLAEKLIPPVEPKQIEEAIQTLLDLGLLKRTSTGELVQSNPSVTTGDEVDSLHVLRFHQEVLEKAKEAAAHLSAEERDIRALLLTCRPDQVERLKSLVQEFREQLLTEFSEAKAGDSQVYMFALQCFPLTSEI